MTLMYNECMTNDTSMLRISNNLHKALKAEAVKQGRTLEWIANDAIKSYLTIPLRPMGPQTSRATEPTVIYEEELPQLPA